MKKFIFLFFLVSLFGCFGYLNPPKPPEPREIKKSERFNKSYDEVWAAIVGTFADLNLNIATIEKESGIIVSKDLIIHKGKDRIYIENEYCDCGSGAPLWFEHYRKVAFNIFINKTPDGSIEVKINAAFQTEVSRTSGRPRTIIDCVSLGKFESEMFELIKIRLQNQSAS